MTENTFCSIIGGKYVVYHNKKDDKKGNKDI